MAFRKSMQSKSRLLRQGQNKPTPVVIYTIQTSLKNTVGNSMQNKSLPVSMGALVAGTGKTGHLPWDTHITPVHTAEQVAMCRSADYKRATEFFKESDRLYGTEKLRTGLLRPATAHGALTLSGQLINSDGLYKEYMRLRYELSTAERNLQTTESILFRKQKQDGTDTGQTLDIMVASGRRTGRSLHISEQMQNWAALSATLENLENDKKEKQISVVQAKTALIEFMQKCPFPFDCETVVGPSNCNNTITPRQFTPIAGILNQPFQVHNIQFSGSPNPLGNGWLPAPLTLTGHLSYNNHRRSPDKRSRLQDGLFPTIIVNTYGQTTGVTGYVGSRAVSKYLLSKTTSDHLTLASYGIGDAKLDDTEYASVLVMLHEAGFPNVVGTLGHDASEVAELGDNFLTEGYNTTFLEACASHPELVNRELFQEMVTQYRMLSGRTLEQEIAYIDVHNRNDLFGRASEVVREKVTYFGVQRGARGSNPNFDRTHSQRRAAIRDQPMVLTLRAINGGALSTMTTSFFFLCLLPVSEVKWMADFVLTPEMLAEHPLLESTPIFVP